MYIIEQSGHRFDSKIINVIIDGHEYNVHEYFLKRRILYHKQNIIDDTFRINIGGEIGVSKHVANGIIDIIYDSIPDVSLIIDSEDSKYYYYFIKKYCDWKSLYKHEFKERENYDDLIRSFKYFCEGNLLSHQRDAIMPFVTKIFEDFGEIKGGKYKGMKLVYEKNVASRIIDSEDRKTESYVFSAGQKDIATQLMLEVFKYEGYNIYDKFLELIGVDKETYRLFRLNLEGCSYNKK